MNSKLIIVGGMDPTSFQLPDRTLGWIYMDGRAPDIPIPNLVALDEHGDRLFNTPIKSVNNCLHMHSAVSPDGVICVVGCSVDDKLVIWLSTIGFIGGDLGFAQRTPVVRWTGSNFEAAVPLQEPYQFNRIYITKYGGLSTTPPEPFDGSSGFIGWNGNTPITSVQGHDIGIFPYLSDSVVSSDVRVGLGPKGLEAIVNDVRVTIYTPSNPREPSVSGDSKRFATAAWLDNGNAVLAICEPPYIADPVVIEKIPVHVDPISRPLWAGVYWLSDKYGDATAPCNCQMAREGTAVVRATKPVICPVEGIPLAVTPIIGIYCECSLSNFTEVVTATRALADWRPLFVVLDGVFVSPEELPGLQDNDILAYELYSTGPDESPESIAARVKTSIAAQSLQRKIALIPQVFDHSTPTNPPYYHLDWIGIFRQALDIARNDKRVVAIIPFCTPRVDSRFGEISDWWNAFVAIILGAPQLIQAPIIAPPVEPPPVVVEPSPIVIIPPVASKPSPSVAKNKGLIEKWFGWE